MIMFTVGMCTYDDYDGVYFTVQSLQLYHPLVTEIIIVDNNPLSKHSELCKQLAETSHKIKYYTYDKKTSTTVKGEIFKYASNDIVVVCDCHILFPLKSFEALKDFYDNYHKPFDLVQGPLLLDDLKNENNCLKPGWGSHFYGIWDNIKISKSYDEIQAQGMGVFSCKKNEWLGFNELFKGFGGEEYYIHDKYRKKGGRCICVKNFKWLHRFGRPYGIPFKNTYEDRFNNYVAGKIELGEKYDEIIDVFEKVISKERMQEIIDYIKLFFLIK
jgi:hypothetical protein